jgi:uncharacterized repeat protein (TIGR01451 family)
MNLLKAFLFCIFLSFSIDNLNAQTMTGTVLAQPCNNDGQIGVTVTGLTPPISYTYTNYAANSTYIHNNINSTSDIVSGLQGASLPWFNSNEWNVFASDGIITVTQTFTLSPAFSYSVNTINATCPQMGTVQATGFVGGTAPFSCFWTNQQSLQSYSSNPAVVTDGPYSLVVTDAAGCMVASPGYSTGIYVYTQSPVTISFTGSIANCTNGTAIAAAGNGVAPYTYLWNNGAVTPGISGLTQGVYQCQATDANGCMSYNSAYTVGQSINLTYNSSVTNATCVQANGSILSFVSGGASPYSYLWNNGATTQNISGLTSNIYNVQITDANGCTGSGSAYVSSTTPISVTYNASPSSCMAPTGSATLTATGGVTPYTIVWNTYPSSTGASISNKASGNYSFKVTDANGCVQTGSVYIPPVSSINAYFYNGNAICPATTGNAQTYVSGTNPPFTYAWSNGATTSSLTGVPLGTYNCVVTDAVGCAVTKYASIVQTSPINVGFSTTQASCIFAADGAVHATAFGGTAPYFYSWSNGQVGANATSLITGNYYVSVIDANGCHNDYNNSLAFVDYNAANNSCYCTITGTVYADANTNCSKDVGETGIQNVQIHCSGLGYAYTDANGVYSFMAPAGTYTLTESVQQIYPLALCQSNNLIATVAAASNCISTYNFANTTIPIHGLHVITTSVNQPIPGNTYYQKVIVQNEGTIAENTVQFGYVNDGQLSYNNSSPWALTQQNNATYPNWYSITSGFPNLLAGTNSSSFINYNVPTNIPLNTVVNFYDTVAHIAPLASSWLTDNTPWNNVDNHQAVVIGSYDPNFKEVTPKGSGVQGFITTSDSTLTYVIHFQNTGSYFAQNIVLIDSLDSDLKIASLRPGYSDHNYTASVSEAGVIKFDFKNINLAWKSNYGDLMSSGLITYSIKLKNNLALGTQIKNTAAIYFDYNEPVITNTTLNTISAPTAIKNIKGLESNDAILYPNPASTDVRFTFSSSEKENGVLSVININGQEVSVRAIILQQGENNLHENVSQLQNGIYFVRLQTNSGIITKKLVIAK